MLRMEEELQNLQIHPSKQHNHQQLQGTRSQENDSNSPESPNDLALQVGYKDSPKQANLIESIMGCLRPVWTMIGKSALSEKAASSKFSLTNLLFKNRHIVHSSS